MGVEVPLCSGGAGIRCADLSAVQPELNALHPATHTHTRDAGIQITTVYVNMRLVDGVMRVLLDELALVDEGLRAGKGPTVRESRRRLRVHSLTHARELLELFQKVLRATTVGSQHHR